MNFPSLIHWFPRKCADFPRLFAFYYVYLIKKVSKNVFNLFRMTRKKEASKGSYFCGAFTHLIPYRRSRMNINLQAVKFTLDEDQKTFVHKKFERIKYAEDLIVDVLCTIKFDKKFTYECTVNFKGGTAHVSTEDYDFKAGVNKLMDVLDQKVRKEKDKIQAKK